MHKKTDMKKVYGVSIGAQEKIIDKVCFKICKKITVGVITFMSGDFIPCFSDDCEYIDKQMETDGFIEALGKKHKFFVRKLKE